MWDEKKVRIVDIAEELGLSTATVSYVLHGKTKRISDQTVKRVQAALTERGYIPNMAATLLAQNNSRIIGVVVNDHPKYEGKVLEDPFVSGVLNALSDEIESAGYFLMNTSSYAIRYGFPLSSMTASSITAVTSATLRWMTETAGGRQVGSSAQAAEPMRCSLRTIRSFRIRTVTAASAMVLRQRQIN